MSDETFYQGPSRTHLASFPPKERWNDWVEIESKAWPQREEHHYSLVPTTCFNCESACGLLAYIDKETGEIRKFEGNPEHPGSRGRNCAKGPATINQVKDVDRIAFPLKRAGERGDGKWVQVGWDEALDDIAARIRRAIVEERENEIMYHVGRPGEDGYTERVMGAWGIDGHNSHTNICSSAARAGYAFWMGIDRPSPDHANADVIFLISSHLEAGHYFNPHAQRIIEAKAAGAKIIVFDIRLSNTATHADHWLAPQPGSEAAILLAMARNLVETGRYNREFVRRWWNWDEYLANERPELPRTFESFEKAFLELYSDFTFEYAAQEAGVAIDQLRTITDVVAGAGTRLSSHNWRSAAAGHLGGWQVSRTLFLLNALMGAVATEGGVYPNAWNKFVPKPIHATPHPKRWNNVTWPEQYPLAYHEMSFLLPHLLRDQNRKLDVYFTRVYNPVWTNPDGMSWIEMFKETGRIGLHVALTPTWSETAYFADYVLPMGLGPERHDIHSYETHDAQWLGFRQPVVRTARERDGEKFTDTRDANPGQVWEENEFWIEMSWRIDPDGKLGIRKYFESKKKPGEKLTLDEYYGFIFENSVPGLPERAAAENLTPLAFMRKYGAFEVARNIGAQHEISVPQSELEDVAVSELGRVYTRAAKPAPENIVPLPAPDDDPDGRRPVGVQVDGQILRGWPTPSGKLEFYSSTLATWGWREYATPQYIKSHVHPDNLKPGQMVLNPIFRLPTQIHTRSANAKWLDELAHVNPLWINPIDAEKLGGITTGDLVRITTEIGYFVLKAWVTEGIRPGVVACSHHMGRWKVGETGQRQMAATVGLDRDESRWSMRRKAGISPFKSDDPDTQRIWWTDVGVHQNLTFCVQPDPISGMHCWHQAVTVERAQPGDAYGNVFVDTEKSRAAYTKWKAMTRPASRYSPNATRRPWWFLRPLRPSRNEYKLPV
ncbi:MAG TPA: molybdopterin-dependent oxidoreductase [Candidatus Baltobacteraceae bacterium]|jgi:anaerobic selenocysteine-containing dehydrogenase